MSSWQVSPILVPLIAEVRAAHPGMTIYTIGDQAHREKPSDHNPDEWQFVCAADFMIGPHFTAAHAEALFQRLRALRDPRTSYAIYDRRIFSRTLRPWILRPYTLDDPHTGHVHVSVVHGATPHPMTSWNIYRKAASMAGMTVQDILDGVHRDLSRGPGHAAGPGYGAGESGLHADLRKIAEDAVRPLGEKLDMIVAMLKG